MRSDCLPVTGNTSLCPAVTQDLYWILSESFGLFNPVLWSEVTIASFPVIQCSEPQQWAKGELGTFSSPIFPTSKRPVGQVCCEVVGWEKVLSFFFFQFIYNGLSTSNSSSFSPFLFCPFTCLYVSLKTLVSKTRNKPAVKADFCFCFWLCPERKEGCPLMRTLKAVWVCS